MTGCPRADPAQTAELAEFGVATVHEAIGRTGYLGPGIRPVHLGTRIGGPAVTVLCWPGDNLMIHAAVEQCQPGDVLVVTTTSASADGAFGELLATSLQHRGVRGLVTTGGVRDVADLHAMGFPVFSAAVSAQGTVKATAGAVNVPVSISGQLITPGDAVVADDDGVVVVPRAGVGRRHRRGPRPGREGGRRARRLPGRRTGPRPVRPAGSTGRAGRRVRGLRDLPGPAVTAGIRCMLMRGGTSKGLYFLATDLPADPRQRDELLLAIMGSGNPLQIDGLGGAHPLTSKVAVVSPSARDDADIDYLFLQLGVEQATITDQQNCGNILAGVGPFAAERGLIAAGPRPPRPASGWSTLTAW